MQGTLEKENSNHHSPEDMSQFLREIREYPLLSQEEELELAKKCAMGDADAIRMMVNSNLRMVVSIARDYNGRGVPLLDLIQEGSIGLFHAAKNYDYTQQVRFFNYAKLWIKQSMDRCVLSDGNVIHISHDKMRKIRKLLAIRNVLREESGVEPAMEQIAVRAEMAEREATELLTQFPQVCSLDAPVSDDATLEKLVENLEAPQPYEEVVKAELSRTLDKLLSLLPERQSLVLRLYFGLDEGHGLSFEQIGERLGFSKQRAVQLKNQAIKNLQKLGAGVGLEEFL